LHYLILFIRKKAPKGAFTWKRIYIYMNYYELNLPFPLKKENLRELLQIKAKSNRSYAAAIPEFEPFISDELASIFKNLDIWPNVMHVFGHITRKHHTDSIIHSDIIVKNNRFVRVPFGLNFEITNEKSNWNWYTPKPDIQEMSVKGALNLFDINLNISGVATPEYIWGSGVHYGKPKNCNPNDFDFIETYELSRERACLVKTNIPHSVTYGEEVEKRLSISFRFSEERIASIEDAVKVFSQHSSSQN
jgi:hypothetical protein